jgi:hypothetical protein
MPTLIDQGYFHTNPYVLPIVGLVIPVLCVAYLASHGAVKNYAVQLFALNRIVGAVFALIITALIVTAFVVGFRRMLTMSKLHLHPPANARVTDQLQQDKPPSVKAEPLMQHAENPPNKDQSPRKTPSKKGSPRITKPPAIEPSAPPTTTVPQQENGTGNNYINGPNYGNPVVNNNYGTQPRTIAADIRDQLSTCLAAHPGDAQIWIVPGVGDAALVQQQWLDLLHEKAHWSVGINNELMSSIPNQGVVVEVQGEGNKVNGRTAGGAAAVCIDKVAKAASIQIRTNGNLPPDHLDIIIGPAK